MEEGGGMGNAPRVLRWWWMRGARSQDGGRGQWHGNSIAGDARMRLNNMENEVIISYQV
jgi:hypothetical protein